MMQKHSETHPTPHIGGDRIERCYWLDHGNERQAGFGLDACHEHVEAVIDGLRYSTEKADLIAATDGEDYGMYLFRTPGGRYFTVSRNYPRRYDGDGTPCPIFLSTAQTLWADIAARAWTKEGRDYAPYDEAFPGLEAIPDA